MPERFWNMMRCMKKHVETSVWSLQIMQDAFKENYFAPLNASTYLHFVASDMRFR